jgi:hypothetical protein
MNTRFNARDRAPQHDLTRTSEIEMRSIRVPFARSSSLALFVACFPFVPLARAAASSFAVAAPIVPIAAEANHQAITDKILNEALAHGQSYAFLQTLCTLAPKRLSGSSGADDAVKWAENEMQRAGLENVHLEECRVPHWVRGEIAELSIVEPSAEREMKLPILALGGSVATPPEGVRGELVLVKTFDELKKLGESVRGKIVFFDRAMDATLLDTFEAYGGAVDQRSRGALEAGKLGAVAAIVRSMTTRIDDFPHTGAMRYADGAPRIPAAAVCTTGAERLSALLRRGAKVELVLKLDCREMPDVVSHNVVGEVRGREKPDEIVLVGAHLDAWEAGQGAHDDGAGCVQCIEALRLVRALDLRPKRTLRAVLFMNEENGLRGALAYHDAHAAELEHHVLAIETDRGGFAPRGFETNASPAAMDLLRPIVATFAAAGGSLLKSGGGGADISPLERDGVTVMEYLPDCARYFDVHHCGRDTIDSVNPRELELGAALIAAMARETADLDTALPRNPKPAAPDGAPTANGTGKK